MKYRILGDIHGRTNWQKLINTEETDITYIFLGDFTDPYYGWEKGVTYEQMIQQINKIFELKKKSPNNIIILAGNHDNQYWIKKNDSNRFDWSHVEEINKLFEDNKELFHGVAYSIGEKYIISHAGVTWDWYQKNFKCSFKNNETSLKEICDNINTLYNSSDEGKTKFTFRECVSKLSDYYGTSSTHSPLWIRPESLWEYNLFGFDSGIIQVVGHTPYETYKEEEKDYNGRITTYGTVKRKATDNEIEMGPNYYLLDGEDVCSLSINNSEHIDIILCDCLRTETACVEINDEDLSWKKNINRLIKKT